MPLQALCIISYPLVNSNLSYSPETPNLGQIQRFLEPCDLEIWWMTLNKANLRDLIAATGLVILLKLDSNRRFFSRETPNLGQNRRFFWAAWPWKTIGHLFYATSSFVQHFIAIGEFQLELQSGNAQSRSKSTIFLAVWPWNLTDDLQKQ